MDFALVHFEFVEISIRDRNFDWSNLFINVLSLWKMCDVDWQPLINANAKFIAVSH